MTQAQHIPHRYHDAPFYARFRVHDDDAVGPSTHRKLFGHMEEALRTAPAELRYDMELTYDGETTTVHVFGLPIQGS